MTAVIVSPQRCLDDTHRSYSGDHGFDECQWRDRQYRLGHVRRIASPRMVVGSAVDEAIGVIVVTGDVPNVSAIVSRLATDEGIDSARVDEMTETAVSLVDLWVRDSWPTWLPVYAYQYELHWTVAGITCHAHLDVVFDDGSVGDIKTSGKRLATNRADLDEQLTWYAWGIRETHGELPPRVFLDGLINANPPKDVLAWRPGLTRPWHDRQWSRRGHVEVDELALAVQRRERVRQFLDASGGHLTNGRGAAFACNDCAVRSECPAWRGYELGAPMEETDAA